MPAVGVDASGLSAYGRRYIALQSSKGRRLRDVRGHQMIDKLESLQRAKSKVSEALVQYRSRHGDDLPETMDWPFGSFIARDGTPANLMDETRITVADMNVGMCVRLHWKSGDTEEGEITAVNKTANTFSYREQGKKLSHSVRMPPDHDGLWVEQLRSEGQVLSDVPPTIWQPAIDQGSVTYVPVAPPCGDGCAFWAPRRDNSTNSGFRCCWAPRMESDFACYKPRE